MGAVGDDGWMGVGRVEVAAVGFGNCVSHLCWSNGFLWSCSRERRLLYKLLAMKLLLALFEGWEPLVVGAVGVEAMFCIGIIRFRCLLKLLRLVLSAEVQFFLLSMELLVYSFLTHALSLSCLLSIWFLLLGFIALILLFCLPSSGSF